MLHCFGNIWSLCRMPETPQSKPAFKSVKRTRSVPICKDEQCKHASTSHQEYFRMEVVVALTLFLFHYFRWVSTACLVTFIGAFAHFPCIAQAPIHLQEVNSYYMYNRYWNVKALRMLLSLDDIMYSPRSIFGDLSSKIKMLKEWAKSVRGSRLLIFWANRYSTEVITIGVRNLVLMQWLHASPLSINRYSLYSIFLWASGGQSQHAGTWTLKRVIFLSLTNWVLFSINSFLSQIEFLIILMAKKSV